MAKDINIIVITIDCLRPDYIGNIGNSESLTPNLDKIAKQGVVFTQAIANGPSTPFSFPSIFASSYALIDPNFPKLSRSRSTLATVLKENGFTTAGINSNPYVSKYYNYDMGFSYFDDIFSEKVKPMQKGLKGFIRKHSKLHAFLRNIKKKSRIKHNIKPPYQRANTIIKKALNWIKSCKRNYFVWLHFMDTHHPFLPPDKFRNTTIRKMCKAEKFLKKNPVKVSEKTLNNIKDQYKATIRYVDEELGKFFNELTRMGLLDNSFILITADHGEEFKEHGGFSHDSKLYEELIHVPLIIKGPEIPKGVIIENLTSLIDLAPTIIEYLNIEQVGDFMGVSFLSLILKNSKGYNRQGVFSESLIKENRVNINLNDASRLISYRTTDWKLIINEERKSKELYNLKQDANEKYNIFDKHPKIAEELEKKILEHIRIEKETQNKLKEREKLGQIAKITGLKLQKPSEI